MILEDLILLACIGLLVGVVAVLISNRPRKPMTRSPMAGRHW